jgi:hypothetical protein
MNTHGRTDLAVEHDRRDAAADPRPVEHVPRNRRHHQRDCDQRNVIDRILQSADADLTEAVPRLRRIQGLSRRDRLGQIVEHQKQSVSRDQDQRLGIAVKPFQHATLDQKANQGSDHAGGRERCGKLKCRAPTERNGCADRIDARIRSDRIERAMGDVEQAENAEHEGQSDRNQEQPRRK